MAPLKMVKMEKIGKNGMGANKIKGKVLTKIFVKPKLSGPQPKTRFGVPPVYLNQRGPPCDQTMGANGKTC